MNAANRREVSRLCIHLDAEYNGKCSIELRSRLTDIAPDVVQATTSLGLAVQLAEQMDLRLYGPAGECEIVKVDLVNCYVHERDIDALMYEDWIFEKSDVSYYFSIAHKSI